ncbi:hypothetical protein [Streptomyces sp. AK02-01A]|uniref:hypothetical protein n=1 Tax=Streptomyces sp. AK02-01A TaxID=3028648 RepID=UPI0029B4BA5C|nr:hypothetical protein [Streptomyces sp. AK02-01A]MDX3853406.1 hypothetical protein [Streptomyces sp. AK02-01A]
MTSLVAATRHGGRLSDWVDAEENLVKSRKVIPGLIAVVAAAGVLAGTTTTMATASTAREVPTASVSHSAKSAAADGQDLFAGFYFGLGKTGESIYKALGVKYDTGALAKNKTPEGRRAVARIVGDVAKKSPTFFADFSAKLRSGDPVQVDQAMSASADELKKYVADSSEADLGAARGLCVFNVVAAFNVATTALGVNFVVLYNQFWTISAAQDEGLGKDESTARLTTHLRTA